jgi:hypothetical protein
MRAEWDALPAETKSKLGQGLRRTRTFTADLVIHCYTGCLAGVWCPSIAQRRCSALLYSRNVSMHPQLRYERDLKRLLDRMVHGRAPNKFPFSAKMPAAVTAVTAVALSLKPLTSSLPTCYFEDV